MRVTNTNDQQLLTLFPVDQISRETTKLLLRARIQVILFYHASLKTIEQLDQSKKGDITNFCWVILAAVSYASMISIIQLANGITIAAVGLIITVLLGWRGLAVAKSQLSKGLDEIKPEKQPSFAQSKSRLDLIQPNQRKNWEELLVVAANRLQSWQVIVAAKSKGLQGTVRTQVPKVNILGMAY